MLWPIVAISSLVTSSRFNGELRAPDLDWSRLLGTEIKGYVVAFGAVSLGVCVLYFPAACLVLRSSIVEVQNNVSVANNHGLAMEDKRVIQQCERDSSLLDGYRILLALQEGRRHACVVRW